jgi:hypothetical protein
MIKIFRVALLSASAAAALCSSPASSQAQAGASATIRKPLTLTSKQPLLFGDIFVSGSGTFNSAVEVQPTGSIVCPATYFTCSGTRQPAVFNASGNKQQQVKVTVDSTVVLQSATAPADTITMSVLLPASGDTLTLTNSGYPGTDFNLGGRLTITDQTQDGVYSGTINVTANYL